MFVLNANTIPRELEMDAVGPEAVLRGRFQLPLSQYVPTVPKMKDLWDRLWCKFLRDGSRQEQRG